MFLQKQQTLIKQDKPVGVKTPVSNNAFMAGGLKNAAVSVSGNGAKKYAEHADPFVTQFGTVAQYMAPRPYANVDKDMRVLYGINKNLAVRFLFYLRMITRCIVLPGGSKMDEPSKGAGLKSEGITRMLWLAVNDPNVFWDNISLFISVGSWKDIFQMLSYDLQFNGWEQRKLDWVIFGKILLSGLENTQSSELVKKYLPQIKSNSQCKTLESQADNIIGKWLCSLIFGGKTERNDYGNYMLYRKLKSAGTAHQWQQLISQSKHKIVDFDTIHGRALAKLVSSKYLKNQGLEDKYAAWIAAKPVAKFTGFVHELAQNVSLNMERYKKDTVNAQFNTLLKLAKINTNESPYRAIGVMDTSGSMGSPMYIGNGKLGKLSSLEVAWPLTIFLNAMLPDGIFKNHYLEFSNVCKMHKINGDNFVDNLLTSDKNAFGGTNFMSVFDLFIGIKRQNPNIPETDFPNMIVAFSDGEFNTVGKQVTNVERGRQALKLSGFSEKFADNFGFCFVDLPNQFYGERKPKFETFDNVKNVFYFSGYDISPLGFLLGNAKVGAAGVPSTASELFAAAMQQDVLNLIQA